MSNQNRKKTGANRNRNRNARRQRPLSNRAAESRANESRNANAVRPTVRKPGTLLDLPKPPKGIVYRWIAKSNFGIATDTYHERLEEGWKPIDPKSLPTGHLYPQSTVSDYGNCITVRGMVACQMSEAQSRANERVYEDQARYEQEVIQRRNLSSLKGDGVGGSREQADQVYSNTIPDDFGV